MYQPIGNYYVIGDMICNHPGDYLVVPLMPYDGSVEMYGKIAVYDRTL